MTIQTEKLTKTTAVLALDGRLDTANAPLLEQKIKQWGADITELILDFAQLEYISSMGLRVLLQAKKTLKNEGRKLTIKNMSAGVREVFEMTGFLNLMVQEEKFVVVRKDEPGLIALLLNGQMDEDNVPLIANELSELAHHPQSAQPLSLILDLGNLSFMSHSGGRALKKAIVDTGWEKRGIKARNVSEDIQAALREAGLGWIVNS